ncbi:MAG: prepilin-type N-terminal cleavage/methylation domain-containing protein [Planctomycetota bacterium]|jgi:prepilin-type N-terminal cleavage/methylation domain-containing protein
MGKGRKNNGFSLMEMLLSIGVLSVGMIFIAGVFPVAIYFSTVSTERTVAAVVADEAFAKIKIYAEGDPNDIIPPGDDIDVGMLEVDELKDFNDTAIFPATGDITADEFAYPSDITDTAKQYYWSALCRLSENDANNPNPPVQVTVFVSRKVAPHLDYYEPDPNDTGTTSNDLKRPVPVKIKVDQLGLRDNELRIDNSADEKEKNFINDGYTIVDDETGRIYRVLKRYPGDNDTIILLDEDWCDDCGDEVWVVPPPKNGSRGPCIAVYQRLIEF